MESLESILSDLQGKYKDPNASKQHKEEKVAENLPSQSSQSTNPPIAISPNSLDSLLNDLQQFANQQTARDQEAIAKLATEWLKKLDPLCGEGLWFESFAKNYSSNLEAAIALLQSK